MSPVLGTLVCALLVTACGQIGDARMVQTEEVADSERLTSLSWIGTYDGWGTVSVGDSTDTVGDLVLRIAFDADSLRRDDCPACLTVTLEPWVSLGNVQPALVSELSLSYAEGGLARSVAISRFSAAGSNANALLVQVLYQLQPDPPETLVADLQFSRR